MEDNTTCFNQTSLKCENKIDLDQLLDMDVDLSKYFSMKELEEMGPDQQRRYKNMAQNYEIMLYLALPAVKPDFMMGPASRTRKTKMEQKHYAEPSSESNSDDEEWTPGMEPKKRRKDSEECKKQYDIDCPVHGSMACIRDKEMSVDVKLQHFADACDKVVFSCIYCRTRFDTSGRCVLHILQVHRRKKLTSKDIYHLDAWLRINKYGRYSRAAKSNDVATKKRYLEGENLCSQLMKRTYSDTSLTSILKFPVAKKVDLNANQHLKMNLYMLTADLIQNRSKSLTEINQIKEKPYRCNVKHTRSHTGEKLCWSCKYASSYKCYIVNHMRIHRGEKPYKCGVCEYASGTEGKLVNHLRTHTGDKPYKCYVCEYATNHKANLVKHMRTHTGDKPYKCDVCEYATNQKANLVKHTRTHTGDKPFKCDVCGYASKQKVCIVEHMRKHTGDKPYKCDVCVYATNQKAYLVKHMRTHTGDKPYKCDVYEYASIQKVSLVEHIRTHTGDKPYKCDVCEYASSIKGNVVKHVRTHTGDKPYKCDM